MTSMHDMRVSMETKISKILFWEHQPGVISGNKIQTKLLSTRP